MRDWFSIRRESRNSRLSHLRTGHKEQEKRGLTHHERIETADRWWRKFLVMSDRLNIASF